MTRRNLLALVLALGALLTVSAPAGAYNERADGYFSFLDPAGKVIFQTALQVSAGDEFIAEDNSHYRVTRVDKDNAFCEYLGKASLAVEQAPSSSSWLASILSAAARPASAVRGKTVALYHTHSDESYVPSDGSASIYANGGIFKVGNAMAATLRRLGLNVIHNTTPHDPHDAMAYTRSRRTAAQLLRRNPAALFDVHRDAVPREQYVAQVKGEDVTKVTLVVGRENPKIKANLNFAKQLKEINDKANPGLIKGIFLARGTYNQDLFDRALLIEAGTHENTRGAAERGIALFADSVPRAIGVAGTPARRQPGPVNQRTGSWSALGWTLLLLILGGAAYLYLSTGSWSELKRKLGRFAGGEFSGLLGRKRK
ncbi:stage II sporulation protein P [Gelria sp. Kuro-4]|uniref:stage II sporulation protein P n=1 Tax=Gelria sp. Kuro-4 TaxID=2796927 RepID=UPI001BEFE780|nr:stage II sporulation protein P [Gelria sp. Kuro-4]BCV25092.1 stage II sporulation protein P [Gelria sp. Kuro-4]